MIKNLFNDNWRVSQNNADVFADKQIHPEKSVTLPHDAVIETRRSKDASKSKGFYQNGSWVYKKEFFVPEGNSKNIFLFEGAYQRAMVYINGDFAGQNPYGYTPFTIEADKFLKPGDLNEISVTVRTADDSRWYTGGGIYRDVYLMTSSLVYIKPYGLKISTPAVTDEVATINVNLSLKNETDIAKQTITMKTELFDATDQLVAEGTQPVTIYRGEEVTTNQKCYIKKPKLWDVETPFLYRCKVTLTGADDTVLDESTEQFGIRTLSLDPLNGLKINNQVIKLRGACIHHDNGPLGSISIYEAEARRIKKLKAAGFNAIRMSHHPASSVLLDVCDEFGMLVMDESFDMWTINKSDFDYGLDFASWWERDITAMVDNCYNHPSVIMYSIGNEIKEVGSANGTQWGRKLADKIKELDNTRYITNCVNGYLAVMDWLLKRMKALGKAPQSTEINNAMAQGKEDGNPMDVLTGSEIVAKATEESFAVVDIAGYNYMEVRYENDKTRFPDRLIVGSETLAKMIDKNWRSVQNLPTLIGDFCWTGWDYIGEAGIGKVKYLEEDEPFHLRDMNVYHKFPTSLAVSGDFDLTGFRKPQSYYREIVFGLRKEPFIAPLQPEFYGRKTAPLPWSWSDAVTHWDFIGFEQKPIKVEVYSHADEVELILNNQSLGKQPAGELNRFKAEFDFKYEPGQLVAINYENGIEASRYQVETPKERWIQANVDKNILQIGEVAFIEVFLGDSEGNQAGNESLVAVDVAGSGTLKGLANGHSDSPYHYFDKEIMTYDGHLIAVIEARAVGEITVNVSSPELGNKQIQIFVK